MSLGKGGFQQVWPLEEETLALCKCGGSRKPFQCTCFLQAGLQALAWLLSVPPWGGGGVSLEAEPEGPRCPCQALLPLPPCVAVWPSGHSLQNCYSQAALCEAWSDHGWRGRSSMETPAFYPSCYSGRRCHGRTSVQVNSDGGYGLLSSRRVSLKFLLEDRPGFESSCATYCYEALGMSFLSLLLLICKVGLIPVFTSEGCCRD